MASPTSRWTTWSKLQPCSSERCNAIRTSGSTGFLAASYGHLGRDEEATAALQMWLAQALAAVGYIPDDAFAGTWGSPFADGIVENRWRNGLRKAGLEE